MTATVERAAAETFRKANGRSLGSEKILGSIVDIRECEIVATHFGPRTSRVTLFITQIRDLGCPGLTTVGTPRPSHGIEQIVKASERLGFYRIQSKLPIQTNSASHSPSTIHVGNQTALAQGYMPTQPSYATQAVRSPKRRKLAPPKIIASDDQNRDSKSPEFTTPSLAAIYPNGHGSLGDLSALDTGTFPLQSEPFPMLPVNNEQDNTTGHHVSMGHTEKVLEVLLGGPAAGKVETDRLTEKTKALDAPPQKTAMGPNNAKAPRDVDLSEVKRNEKSGQNANLMK